MMLKSCRKAFPTKDYANDIKLTNAPKIQKHVYGVRKGLEEVIWMGLIPMETKLHILLIK